MLQRGRTAHCMYLTGNLGQISLSIDECPHLKQTPTVTYEMKLDMGLPLSTVGLFTHRMRETSGPEMKHSNAAFPRIRMDFPRAGMKSRNSLEQEILG